MTALAAIAKDRPLRAIQLDDIERRRARGLTISADDEAIARAAANDLQEIAVTSSRMLDEIETYLDRFISYPSEAARIAHTLWIAHTHLMDAWESTPRLAFLSPEPGSGKSRALEVMEPLVPRPVCAVNVTPAYLFRKVADEDGAPTILYDEIDTVFGPKAKENEEIRGLLNAGHRRGACAGRCVVRGKEVFTEEIPAYCAVALAGLGSLPDTILTRSIIVKMRRRAPGEQVEPYRRRIHEPQGAEIGQQLADWAEAIHPAITWPEMPPGIEDRNADIWEPLLAVADVAGPLWVQRGREAASAIVAESKQSPASLGIQLLGDLREVFGESTAMSTEMILERLHALPESPWGDLRGKPLDARGLGNRLRQYGIRSKTVRLGTHTPKGYTREDLHDAWIRYLPPPLDTSATSATSATTPTDQGLGVEIDRNSWATEGQL